MAIRILPNQIPMLWDTIKFIAVKVGIVGEELYFNQLLIDLLNDKAQCFVRLDHNRHLQALAITKFVQDTVTTEKSLVVSGLYSFDPASNDQWKLDMNDIVKFARANGCKIVSLTSANNRIFELVSLFGFSEKSRNFTLEI
jgi:hypothetical protein